MHTIDNSKVRPRATRLEVALRLGSSNRQVLDEAPEDFERDHVLA